MARVTYGPLITAFSGSIGGITFQRNSSGNIARMRPAPPVVSSALQAAQQARLITTVNYWSKLTCPQKALWNQFAIDHPRTNDWGEIHTLNGLEWFMSVNLNLFDPVECPSGDPPAWSVVEPLDPFVIISEPTVFNLYWSVEQV